MYLSSNLSFYIYVYLSIIYSSIYLPEYTRVHIYIHLYGSARVKYIFCKPCAIVKYTCTHGTMHVHLMHSPVSLARRASQNPQLCNRKFTSKTKASSRRMSRRRHADVTRTSRGRHTDVTRAERCDLLDQVVYPKTLTWYATHVLVYSVSVLLVVDRLTSTTKASRTGVPRS